MASQVLLPKINGSVKTNHLSSCLWWRVVLTAAAVCSYKWYVLQLWKCRLSWCFWWI